MARMLMLAVVIGLGCNYYGPDNPPPEPTIPPPPTYHLTKVEVTGANGFAAATCPTGSFAVGVGCDCVSCAPADPNAFLFGCNINSNATAGGCYPGCVHVEAICISSSKPGTLASPLETAEPDPEAQQMIDRLRAGWEARVNAHR